MKGSRGTRRGANPPHSTVHTQATTLASPVNVATFNTNNNLFSDKKPFRACSSGRSTEPCLNLIHEHFVSSDADFMCLQEVGTWSDVTPPIVAKRFERDASVYTCGQRVTEDPGSSGVMIIVRHGWVVEKLDRHPSGRLMIVSATQGACRVTVACAYMPSGLDNAPRVPRDGWGRASEVLYNKRLLAQEVYDYAWRAYGGWTFMSLLGTSMRHGGLVIGFVSDYLEMIGPLPPPPTSTGTIPRLLIVSWPTGPPLTYSATSAQLLQPSLGRPRSGRCP